MIVLAHHGLLLASAGNVCPNYSTVTLQLTSETYSAPDGDDAELQFLPCPYTAPEVE